MSRTKLFLLSVALLVACTRTQTSTAGKIVGSHDMVLQGRFIFITSADTNELRVLDVDAPNAATVVRHFVTGPNPLETMSIPVVDRPTTLTQDLVFNADGTTSVGAYVFVGRPGGAELSVVHAPGNLLDGGSAVPSAGFAEYKRIVTAAPVTAMAAHRQTTSTLYAASFDGQQAVIAEFQVPDPDVLRLASTKLSPRVVATFDGSSVSQLLVLPALSGRTLNGQPFCATKPCLVAATRKLAGTGGETRLIDPDTRQSALLNFPSPVRVLRTHSATANLGAGQRVVALLDEERCSGCAGVVGVDTLTATKDGFPLVGSVLKPNRPSEAFLVGIALVAGPQVHTADQQAVEVLGALTQGDGQIFFFDAANVTSLTQTVTASDGTSTTSDFGVSIDTLNTSTCNSPAALLPGQPIWDTAGEGVRLYVAYPSASSVAELWPTDTAFTRGAISLQNRVTCYR